MNALLMSDLAFGPINIVALVMRIRRETRIGVFHHDSSAHDIEAVANHEPAGRVDFRMRVKGDGAFGAQI
jgi:hypothetical protein